MKRYTTRLQAGLGMVHETGVLLTLWRPGMSSAELCAAALASGRFAGMSARRLRNVVTECFAPRLLTERGRPAAYVQALTPALALRELEQILLVYACRANAVLADFILEVFRPAYALGRAALTNQEALDFVVKANQQGLTAHPWSAGTLRRVAGYLTGACADFGLLERGAKTSRKILPWAPAPKVIVALAYELHFAGLGDNSVAGHPDWALFGLERAEVVAELKRLSMQGFFLVQTAGELVRIGWPCGSPEELRHALAQGRF